MKLTDILPVEKWAELEERIQKKTGLDTTVYLPTGISITEFKKWENSLCPAIKKNKKGLSFICAVVNQHMAQVVSQTKKPFIEECDAGLARIAVPIFIKDQFLGTVGACGKIMEGNDVESFFISKTTGIDEEEINRLSFDISTMTPTEAEGFAAYMDEQIKEIIAEFMKNHET